MPGRDGTGPVGNQPGSGRRPFGGGGRGGGAPGSDGVCVCPSCGATAPHRRAVPCFAMTCPKCGAKMTRG
jgi:hypothetical protein